MIKKNLIAPLIFSLVLGFNMNTASATDYTGVLEDIGSNCNFNNLGEAYNKGCGAGNFGIACSITDTNYINFIDSFVTLTANTCLAQSGRSFDYVTDSATVIYYCIPAVNLDACLQLGFVQYNVIQNLGGERLNIGKLVFATT